MQPITRTHSSFSVLIQFSLWYFFYVIAFFSFFVCVQADVMAEVTVPAHVSTLTAQL